MQFLTEWITNIIVFVLLATVIDMLLPNSSMQKYTKIVTGLLLITIILTPLLKLMSSDFEEVLETVALSGTDENKSVENSIEFKKKEIQASQRAYILEQMAVQMKEQAEKELIAEYEKEIVAIDIQSEDLENLPDSIQQVHVELKDYAKGSVEVVQRVEVGAHQQEQPIDRHDDISAALAEQWNLSTDQVIILEKGGMGKENEL